MRTDADITHERRLLVGMIFLAIAFVPPMAFAIASIGAIGRSQARIHDVAVRDMLLAQELRLRAAQQGALMPVFVLSGDPRALEGWRGAGRAFDAILARINRRDRMPDERAALDRIGDLHRRLDALGEAGIATAQRGAGRAEVEAYFHDRVGPQVRLLVAQLDRLSADATRSYEAEMAHDRKRLHGIVHMLLGASCAAVLCCLAAIGLLARLLRRKRRADMQAAGRAVRERHVSEARKQAVETVAHDLKNPLTSIMMLTDTMRDRLATTLPDKPKFMLEGIALSAQSMHVLIENLLSHAKIESGTLCLAPEPCDLAALFARLAARFEPIAARKGVALANEAPAALSPVPVDPARIEQVLSNLIGNAIKFTDRGGIVRLGAAPVGAGGESLELWVADTGRGMTPQQTARVFERYWQAPDAAAQGSGLGLAISKAIVEAHGGTLAVESAPGAGSVFRVRLGAGAPAGVPVGAQAGARSAACRPA